ncbi:MULTISPECIES: hypothetical protein [Pararhodobacter]|nr:MULTISPECIES: hypothetical protein [Pararhodobacter]PTX00847.1 hypothetical protein C8N33_109191 [Pararhodobacter aggregans]
MRQTSTHQAEATRQQPAHPWSGGYLYGSDRAGSHGPGSFSGGAAGGVVR